jgi:hypothetical protein
MMTIETITPSKNGGFFAMLLLGGIPTEMFFDTFEEIGSYVDAFNAFTA